MTKSNLEPLTDELKEHAWSIECKIRERFGRFDEYESPIKDAQGKNRSFGFDWNQVLFLMADWEKLAEVAGFGGFLRRYRHYSFGEANRKLYKQRKFNMGKIYELVINNNPAYAYLLKGNSVLAQKTVMAHVFFHADFFKNNICFRYAQGDMVGVMAKHKEIVDNHIVEFGYEKVTRWIDVCRSIDNMIDRFGSNNNQFLENKLNDSPEEFNPEIKLIDPPEGFEDLKDLFNPEEFVKQQKAKKEQELILRKQKERGFITINRPSLDLMGFLSANAHLENWQREILNLVRTEALYFSPQYLTKIMNEGWATYWHTKFMNEEFLASSEIKEFANMNAGVLGRNKYNINPYRLGKAIFEDIESKWNTGRHGWDFKKCTNRKKRHNWDTKENKGLEKMFEIRSRCSDLSFLSEFLSEEVVEKELMYSFIQNHEGAYIIRDREVENIRNNLVKDMGNAGQPMIYVLDVTPADNTLLLWHDHTGTDLKEKDGWLDGTLKNIGRIWTHPIQLMTIRDEKVVTHSYKNGKISSDSKVYIGPWKAPYRKPKQKHLDND